MADDIDLEALLTGWLSEVAGGLAGASTRTPPDLEQRLPWVRVALLGGPYDGFRIDRPLVDLESFAATAAEASALARQIQGLLYSDLLGRTYGGAVVARVRTDVGTRPLPYDNPAVHRYGGTYRLAVHPA